MSVSEEREDHSLPGAFQLRQLGIIINHLFSVIGLLQLTILLHKYVNSDMQNVANSQILDGTALR
jgi:hypothetical protein